MPSEARDLAYLDLPIGDLSASRRPRLRAVGDPLADEMVRWSADVGDLPARLIGSLPVPMTLRLRAVDGSTFHVSSSVIDAAQLRESGAIVLDAAEWDVLVLAAEADRAWPADLVRSLRMRGASGQLTADALLDGISVDRAERDVGRLFSTERVLARLGARIESVWLEDQSQAPGSSDLAFR